MHQSFLKHGSNAMFRATSIIAAVGLLATTACLALVGTQAKTADQDSQQTKDKTQSYYIGEGFVNCDENSVTIMTKEVGVLLRDEGALYAATEPEEVDPWGEEWSGEVTLEVKDGFLFVEVVSAEGQCTSFTFELEDEDTTLDDLYAGDPEPAPDDLPPGVLGGEFCAGGDCSCSDTGCSCSACCPAGEGPARCRCDPGDCTCKCLKVKKVSALIEYSAPSATPTPNP